MSAIRILVLAVCVAGVGWLLLSPGSDSGLGTTNTAEAAAAQDKKGKKPKAGTKKKGKKAVGSKSKKTAKGKTKSKASPQHVVHVKAALHNLHQARADLDRAPLMYGGHRERALRSIRHAIHQLHALQLRALNR